jgi:hypothetical protein
MQGVAYGISAGRDTERASAAEATARATAAEATAADATARATAAEAASTAANNRATAAEAQRNTDVKVVSCISSTHTMYNTDSCKCSWHSHCTLQHPPITALLKS